MLDVRGGTALRAPVWYVSRWPLRRLRLRSTARPSCSRVSRATSGAVAGAVVRSPTALSRRSASVGRARMAARCSPTGQRRRVLQNGLRYPMQNKIQSLFVLALLHHTWQVRPGTRDHVVEHSPWTSLRTLISSTFSSSERHAIDVGGMQDALALVATDEYPVTAHEMCACSSMFGQSMLSALFAGSVWNPGQTSLKGIGSSSPKNSGVDCAGSTRSNAALMLSAFGCASSTSRAALLLGCGPRASSNRTMPSATRIRPCSFSICTVW